MKEYVQQEPRRLYVVTSPRSEAEAFDPTQNSLDRSFEGWLQSQEATEELKMSAPAVIIDNDVRRPSTRAQWRNLQLYRPLEAVPAASPNSFSLRPKRLTTDDYLKVMLATVREGRRHARWPKEALEHFLAAEVITEPELGD